MSQVHIYKNSYYELSFNGLCLSLEAFGKRRSIVLPQVEVNKTLIKEWKFISLESGEVESTLHFSATAELEISIRHYPDSPFIRIRHCLKGSGNRLTKADKQDNFMYTCFILPTDSTITEIQLNQYESTGHAYLPHLQPRPETVFAEETILFAGPSIMAENGDHAIICAYEHGGEYTDRFFAYKIDKMYNADKSSSSLSVSLECVEGTYCNNEYFDDATPYITPWFHLGVCASDEILPMYRQFILHNLSDSPASRKPYIFYNTWNNQERNKAFRNRKYLQDMNTRQMCKEIDIAHRMGIDVFVIDTGWYRSTGDWDVDLTRFPDDLAEVRALLKKYGMTLGLWFNPAAAAVNSQVGSAHPEYRKQVDGQDVNIGPVWETEESFGMCLVSDYRDWFIEKLVEVGERYDVRYFKWDAVDMSGCNSPNHHHGGEESTPEEREINFRFKCGMALTHIAAEVGRRLPGAIVDLDVTEGRRYVGLDFLSAGKFFHMNNGPYYHDFDIPNAKETYKDNWNVFFYPGSARNRVCRQALQYDKIIPSILFLTHFLPDAPISSQNETLASLVLGGNGIWGDLHSLTEEEIKLFADTLEKYKQVADDVTNAYPKHQGFTGASPEVYEKINHKTGRGIVVFFTREPTVAVYYTNPSDVKYGNVDGADASKVLADGRLRLEVSLGQNESRIVFIGGQVNG
ncbi:MAG: alpha-galactosidase [Oscillospiraceae bacterium]|nr:alpha-galactosidase [Oscillospiraceae bacterium]